MSISVNGFKGPKELFSLQNNKAKLKNEFLKVIKKSLYKDIGSLISLSLARYKMSNSINDALSEYNDEGSLKTYYRDFSNYPIYQKELEPFYKKMEDEFNEINIFEFYKKAFELTNKLDKEHPNHRGLCLSSRIVNVSGIEYQFKNYSIYQFFYGANKFSGENEKSIKKIKELKSYYYYDHTDKPDNICNRLWKKRSKDWWSIINRSGSYMSWCPANGGKQIDFLSYQEIDFNIIELQNFKNTTEKNANKLMKRDLLKELMDSYLEEEIKESGMTRDEFIKASSYSYHTGSFLKARDKMIEMEEENDVRLSNKEKIYLEMLKK